MSTPAPDREARAFALDTSRSVIVKAPAGSGKTSLLVDRFLALLARVQRPEEVVAITFTRKAAAEMRARVLDALRDALEPPPRNAHERRRHALAAAVNRRDRDRGWSLRDAPQRLAIGTIDALCAGLARRLPLRSGLGGPLPPLDDPTELYREAARRTTALLSDRAHGAVVQRMLAHLDGDLAAFERLLAQMLARRDQWTRYLRPGEALARRGELESGLQAVIAAVLDEARLALPSEQVPALLAAARHAGARASRRGTARGAEFAALDRIERLPDPEPGALGRWRALVELLLTAQGRLRARPPSGVFVAAEAPAAYQQMKALLATLAGAPSLPARLQAVRALPPPHYDDAQWQTLLDLLQTLRLALAGLRLVFAERGRSDFQQQVAAAAEALGDEDTPSDLALALDHRIVHLLVDEFQDTSAAHFDVVRRLTAGWAPGDGRTLFLVGDPVQSIYRFREAEVGLFLRCYRDGLAGLALERVDLSANFRAQAGLVDWVNATFQRALPRRDEAALGAVRYEAAVATRAHEEGPAVRVHALLDADEAVAAERAADAVATALTERPDDRIAVLLRARAHAPAVLHAMDRRGIRWRGVDLQPLSSEPAVQDLHALTLALLRPLDRVSWLALLRAPWCGLCLDDLETLVADAPGVAVAALLGDAARCARLSNDGRARVARVAPLLLEAAAARDRVARRVERCWRALGGPACLQGAPLDDARRYLRLLAEIESGDREIDTERLCDRLEALHASPSPHPAQVEVMTIHKAKGLEFDVVVLPALERAPRREGAALLAWSETVAANGAQLLLAPLPAPGGSVDGALHRFVRGVESSKRSLERTRLLYVACTRARRRLHLIGCARTTADRERLRCPPAESMLADLWPLLAGEFERALARAPAPGVPARSARQGAELRRVPAGWRAPPMGAEIATAAVASPPIEPLLFDWAGRTARHVGTVAHGGLRRIASDGIEAWTGPRLAAAAERWRDALAALGVPAAELDSATERVGEILRRALSDPRGRWLLSGTRAEARSEYALSGSIDGRLLNVVLDRTFVEDGVRWIVDYKTGWHEGAGVEQFLDREQLRYREQLERYASLVAAREQRPIRLGLYFPALSGWREWAWSRST